MEVTEGRKEVKPKSESQEVDRRKFIEKSARDIGAYSFAIYDLAKTIKNEMIQEVINEIKYAIRK